MKIGFVMQDTGRIWGAERATLDLLCGLRDEGLSVSVLLIHEKRLKLEHGDLKTALSSEGIPTVQFDVRNAFSPALVRGLTRAVSDGGVDIVHTIGPKATLHGWLAFSGMNIKRVSTVHGWLLRPDPKERFYEWLEKQALRRFDRVVVLSKYYRDLMEADGVDANRLVWIPAGVKATALVSVEEALASLDPIPVFTVGMLGRLSEEKNHAMFIRAARLLVEKRLPVRFVIAGEGRLKADIRRMIEESSLNGCMELAGYMDAGEFMKRIHCLAVCSRIENLPQNIKEAMAWCRPVVATGVGGIPDLVVDGETGFQVSPDAVREMAGRLSVLASDRGLVTRLGRGGRAKLEREFSIKRSVEAHRAMYGELVCTVAGSSG